MTDISFTVSGMQVRGKLFSPSGAESNMPAILFLHGWTSRQDRYLDVAQTLSESGYCCLTVDFRGHGSSDGDVSVLTRTDFLADVVASYDFLSKVPGVDAKHIIVVGSSFGAYLAALLAAERFCYALGMRVPANYPDVGFDEPHINRATAYYEGDVDAKRTKWKTTVHPYAEISTLRAMHEYVNPVLIVESELDELVPKQVLQSYAEALPDQKQLTYMVMKGASHSLSRDEARAKEFETILVNWIKSIQN